MEDKEASSEHSISAKVMPQDRTLKAGLSPQKAHLCEMCGPMLRDSLHLVEHQETHHRPKLHMCGACGKQFPLTADLYQLHKQRVGEKCFKSNEQSLVLEELLIPCVGELLYP